MVLFDNAVEIFGLNDANSLTRACEFEDDIQTLRNRRWRQIEMTGGCSQQALLGNNSQSLDEANVDN